LVLLLSVHKAISAADAFVVTFLAIKLTHALAVSFPSPVYRVLFVALTDRDRIFDGYDVDRMQLRGLGWR
jgi:hypothetical protein